MNNGRAIGIVIAGLLCLALGFSTSSLLVTCYGSLMTFVVWDVAGSWIKRRRGQRDLDRLFMVSGKRRTTR